MTDEQVRSALALSYGCHGKYAEAINAMCIALTVIGDWPVTDPTNMDAENMRAIAKAALTKTRELV